MISSLIIDETITYPEQADSFSPGEAYPEYRFTHLATHPNKVYRAIRDCFAQAGFDADHFGTSTWNPLRDMIPEGSRVFILCNFVYHRRENESLEDFGAKCTHGSVLRAVVDYLLLAVGPSGKIFFGNAPVQSCDWDRVLDETGAAKVRDFYHNFAPGQVEACDLRSHIVKRSVLGGFVRVDVDHELGCDVDIDLGRHSLLEELYRDGVKPQFRSLDYNPEMTDRFHGVGRHIYTVNRKVLEADVIVSLPKLKVHEKVGATLAIKGCVGSITHKHCLAHFRLGSGRRGGDEYAEARLMNKVESWLGEHVNRLGESGFKNFCRSVNYLLRKLIVHGLRRNVGGGWSGNDTTWRMGMDIARILVHADKDGRMHSLPRRRHLALIDGVVGGEGQGPLSPRARHTGMLLFSDDVVSGDAIACRFMGLDPSRLPVIYRAFNLRKYPLSKATLPDVTAYFRGQQVTVIPSVDPPFTLPYGW